MKCIDIHAHIVDADYLEALQQLLGLELTRSGDKTFFSRDGNTFAWSRPDMFDVDERLRAMDRKRIDMRALSLSTPNVYVWDAPAQVKVARMINDRVAALCRAHPDRFVGLASLPLGDVQASLEELDRATGELGMKGLALGSNIAGMALDDPSLEPLWARLGALRLPMFMHPMFPEETANMKGYELPLRLGFPFDTTLAATRLIYSGVLERHPGLTFVLAHTGGTLLTLIERLDNGYRIFPACREHISQPPSVYARRLYFDTASFSGPVMEMALRFAGPGNLLFATDDPYIDASDRTHVEQLGLAPADEAAVLGGNAARLLGIAV
jgi:aminocarboxymuconate-semialdehyde decarboxylase